MNINVHIERLILDGLPLQPRDGPLLQAAMAAELSRLLAASGIPPDFRQGGDRALILAPALRLDPSPDARVLGAQVGAGLYSAIAGSDQQGHNHG